MDQLTRRRKAGVHARLVGRPRTELAQPPERPARPAWSAGPAEHLEQTEHLDGTEHLDQSESLDRHALLDPAERPDPAESDRAAFLDPVERLEVTDGTDSLQGTGRTGLLGEPFRGDERSALGDAAPGQTVADDYATLPSERRIGEGLAGDGINLQSRPSASMWTAEGASGSDPGSDGGDDPGSTIVGGSSGGTAL